MHSADIVVLGGSAAGITAAITARRHHPDKSILLVRKEKQVPIPCGIPYIYGTLGGPEKNLIPDTVLDSNKIDLLVSEVTQIDRKQCVLATGEGEVRYERLILATGSIPTQPPIPGVDLDGVFTILKDVEHLVLLQQRLKQSRNIVIIGGGFIGIEFADEINKIDSKNVTVLELAANCLSLSYDAEFCSEMETLLLSRGVTVRTSATVARIVGDGHVSAVEMKDGRSVSADLVILGIGAKANVDLAKETELRLGLTGSVAVDRTMQTSDPAIFACGDCAEKISFFGGGPSPLKLASIAQLEARIAGANVYGLRRESDGTLGVWSTAVGDLAMGTAGLTESMAKDRGYEVVAGTVETPNRHPGGMPGTAPVKVKLVFEKHSQVLLGGQVRGTASVGELINTIAACVQKRMTAEDIAMFQMGTHPALTASPIAYPLVNAAEVAISCMQ
ncbi:MAG: FAD-dependent oxidoreductase [Planctomycetes bacterium]|jgi:NADPH-dependent 2,4-dienoyl-CoA reductase/sulfur reductase-like enzyme|nr:FAD-dependent oxidoreductase [Phycisphaerae bacterium]NBB94988.1 FAD-dependent oxidoreductase [Planctomycetota bacterium]